MANLLKRAFVGRPIDTADAGHTLLPKTIALPVFASDPLSSVAYATQEILLVLSLAGLAYFHFTPWLGAGVVLLLVVVTLSYRQTIRAYPNGGGAYVVAKENLGEAAGLTAAAALLIDYVLTVAVSTSAGVDAILSAAGSKSLADQRVLIALAFVLLVTLLNLRGVKESGTFFAIPTYLFVGGIFALIGTAIVRMYVMGDAIKASTAGMSLEELSGGHHETLTTAGLAGGYLLLRAFSSGCTALTGVEAISNGVPSFRKDKIKNANATLTIMAAIAVTMFASVTLLAREIDVRVTEEYIHNGGKTVLAQLGAAFFGGDKSFMFYFLQATTAGILILAANTAYNGFPALASILAKDGYMPRQLANRGDRLVFSNGVVVLAVLAGVLIVSFDAEVTRLVQLYIVGVFVSFTASQLGMVRHWQRLKRTGEATSREVTPGLIINSLGSATTGLVLIIVLLSKFTHGAYIPVIGGVLLFVLMRAIKKHYARVARQIKLNEVRAVLPARNHAVVLVSSLSVPSLRALNYARSINAHTLQAVSIAVDPDAAKALEDAWDTHKIDIPLVRVASPYRDLTRPLVDFVKNIRRESANDVVTVILPEFVVTKWWEQLLHGQSAFLIKLALLRTPGVVLTNVPWHLADNADADNDGVPDLGPLPAMSTDEADPL
ncbi:MAG: APC family permease [Mycobacteriales bacterium]